MTNNPTIDGVSRELIERILAWLNTDEPSDDGWVAELRALLDAPAVERQEPVAFIEWSNSRPEWVLTMLCEPAIPPNTPVHLYQISPEIAALYQQNAVWFWQHDGEDYLESLSCPIIIQPHDLLELLGKTK